MDSALIAQRSIAIVEDQMEKYLNEREGLQKQLKELVIACN